MYKSKWQCLFILGLSLLLLATSAWAGVGSKFLGIESTVIIHIPSTVPTTINDRISDIAACPPPVDGHAYTGTETYAGKPPMKDLRILSNYGTTDISIVVPANSSIKGFKDFVGKRVAVGKKGMLAEMFFNLECQAFGIKTQDINVMYLGHEEAGTNMTLGKLDAVFVLGPHPHPTYGQVDLTFPLRFVQLSDQELSTITKAIPYLYLGTLPKIYHSEGTTYKTPFLIQQQLTSTRVPEDTAYKLVKAYMENPEFLKFFSESLKQDITMGIIKTATESISWGVPYHAGSVRYFKEMGWKVPADRIPAESK
jgi:TRAP transporter TAXI family solute receptor